MNGMKKSLMISIFAVLIMGIVISGCLDSDDETENDSLDVEVKIYSDEDAASVKVLDGSITWADMELRVDNNRLSTSTIVSEKGDETNLIDVTDNWDPVEGTTYVVQIVEISSNKVLWEDNIIAEGKNEVQIFNVKGSIYADPDQVELEVISGEIDWRDYKVMVDGNYLETDTNISNAGETVVYYDPDSTWDPEPGTSYTVKVIDISENRIVWEDDIITKMQ